MRRTDEYIEILRLDNFIHVLSWQERLQICQYRANKTDEVPEKVKLLQEIIRNNGWDIPEFRYSDDRELKWLDNGIPRAIQFFPLKIIYELKNII
ncbi:hypothetical protein [Capnocytophaga catalasegens]|uniref:Uncharacterized protein n=1 Tax=Capnocytophaga catalasegens TaxID=1004260 RepID=A0AAV5AZV3_9FLAO|nr:hypothetical protein [Capnocytophaga catalasegens]GIZ15278.1 hypothetical protein RCZ03_12780 [Capnocytophaga catalasegens]GJM51212.1 hypothetical protein RCZ15_21850 [Capnocytophaga catalasegens]GJM53006.1 hypothetical protein RCZ16_13230 [Capnocytophaga catalasegens]